MPDGGDRAPGGRIDGLLVAGGQWHDIDFARLELLKLLAEDERVLARNIAQSLRKTGAQVLHAPSAAAAREALNGEDFNLFIADISLGDGNG